MAAHLDFIHQPTARNWYRAHNASIASGYLDNEALAAEEGRVERFFINVVLVRVLFAHALVAAPRLALGRLSPVARPVGDPRIGMTGIFMSLSRVLPDEYPLGDDVDTYVAVEHGFGHMLDIGIIAPRFSHLYDWSADVLALPALRGLVDGSTPTYAWDSKPTPMCGISSRRGRAACPAVRTRSLAGRLIAFARKGEATVGRLLDQPVDEQ